MYFTPHAYSDSECYCELGVISGLVTSFGLESYIEASINKTNATFKLYWFG